MMSEKHDEYIASLRLKINNWLQSEVGKRNRWSKYIALTPDIFQLLCRLAVEKRLDDSQKARIGAAIAYFVSPLDLIPEQYWGAHGFVDDIGMAAYVLRSIDPEILSDHWALGQPASEIVNEILLSAEEMMGGRIWQQIQDLADKGH